MARPTKENMPYFSHDTDARNDRKLKLFIANAGLMGYGFFWAILEDVYNHSYYLPWTEEDQYLFVADFNCGFSALTYEDVSELFAQAFRWGIFDEKLFQKYQILTSPSIQRRYLKQSSRRVLVEMIREYMLIDVHNFYQKELESATVSVRISDVEGNEVEILGSYEEASPKKPDKKPEAPAEGEPKPKPEEKPEYDTKYDFNSTELWDGKQPIDYKACTELWNKINGASSRVTEAKKTDLRRVFRNYTGRECLAGMIVRAKDEMISDSRYKTDWSTLFGAKKLENLDKWVGRGREWHDKQQGLQTVADHVKSGWMSAKKYEHVCKGAGIEFDDAMFCETKQVEGSMLYYPKFDF